MQRETQICVTADCWQQVFNAIRCGDVHVARLAGLRQPVLMKVVFVVPKRMRIRHLRVERITMSNIFCSAFWFLLETIRRRHGNGSLCVGCVHRPYSIALYGLLVQTFAAGSLRTGRRMVWIGLILAANKALIPSSCWSVLPL